MKTGEAASWFMKIFHIYFKLYLRIIIFPNYMNDYIFETNLVIRKMKNFFIRLILLSL